MHNNVLLKLDKETFNGLSKLNFIDLSYNKIRSLEKGTFEKTLRLTTLDLSFNQLEFIDKYMFYDLKVLTHIWLNNNKFIKNEHLELILDSNVQYISFKFKRDFNNIDLIYDYIR